MQTATLVTIRVIATDGTERLIQGEEGVSLMQILRDNAVDGVLALCGGCCSCGTCHVFIDPQYVAELPPMSADERDLLESSSYRNERSRLACQVRCTAALDGLPLQIAPED